AYSLVQRYIDNIPIVDGNFTCFVTNSRENQGQPPLWDTYLILTSAVRLHPSSLLFYPHGHFWNRLLRSITYGSCNDSCLLNTLLTNRCLRFPVNNNGAVVNLIC